MKKLISFLGTYDYQETDYQFSGQTCRSPFFTEAAVTFFKPEKVLVCTTMEVLAHQNFRDLSSRLASRGYTDINLNIPSGASEQELWQIFHAIAAAVDEGDRLIFDITNSFRSIPMLVLLVIAYLKAVKNVQVERVVYGAFTGQKETRVFDLTPFVSLLDWLSGAQRFLDSGDASRLSSLLTASLPSARQSAEKLGELSQSMLVCQPFSVMNTIPILLSLLEDERKEMGVKAPAFELVLPKITSELGRLSVPEGQETRRQLLGEYALLEWYFSNQQFLQTVTLAREWLIDMAAWRAGLPLDFRYASRDKMEKGVSGMVMDSRPNPKAMNHLDKSAKKRELNDEALHLKQHLPAQEKAQIAWLWDNLPDIRNAWTHAEHREDCIQWKKALRKLNDEIMPKLKELSAWLNQPDRVQPHA